MDTFCREGSSSFQQQLFWKVVQCHCKPVFETVEVRVLYLPFQFYVHLPKAIVTKLVEGGKVYNLGVSIYTIITTKFICDPLPVKVKYPEVVKTDMTISKLDWIILRKLVLNSLLVLSPSSWWSKIILKKFNKLFLGFVTNWAKPLVILSVYFMVMCKPNDKVEWELGYQKLLLFHLLWYPLAEMAEIIKV